MKIPLCTTISFRKSAEFRVLQGTNLRFVNHFMTTIECKRAHKDGFRPGALFCDVEFVCVNFSVLITFAYALVIQTHLRPYTVGSESGYSLSLFLMDTMAL